MIFCNVENCANNKGGKCTVVIHIENGECTSMDVQENSEEE